MKVIKYYRLKVFAFNFVSFVLAFCFYFLLVFGDPIVAGFAGFVYTAYLVSGILWTVHLTSHRRKK